MSIKRTKTHSSASVNIEVDKPGLQPCRQSHSQPIPPPPFPNDPRRDFPKTDCPHRTSDIRESHVTMFAVSVRLRFPRRMAPVADCTGLYALICENARKDIPALNPKRPPPLYTRNR
jgi:hypothetical protein